MTRADVPQSLLDALVRTGSVRIPGATPPYDRVEISHIFVGLDIALNGLSAEGMKADFQASLVGQTVPYILTWAGDVGSAWLGYQKPMEVERLRREPAGRSRSPPGRISRNRSPG